MTPRHMALAAAIMAMQATALYLISASSGQASTVYRCGTLYQDQPCNAPDERALQLDDRRDARQLQQAQASQHKQQRWLAQTEKSNRAWARRMARHKASAVALSCIQTGQRPFEACADDPGRSQRRPHRGSRPERPFVARVQNPQEIGASISER